MSLTALPVSVSDLTTLQQGIQFFTNNNEAAAQAGGDQFAGHYYCKCVYLYGPVA